MFTDFCLISFFTSVLPTALGQLVRAPQEILETAGTVLFVSAASFAGGTLLAPLLAARFGETPAIRWCHALACIFGGLLGLGANVWALTSLRAVEACLLGPVISLTTSRTAALTNPQALGVLNSARMTANFVGPVVATTLLSFFPLNMVFVLLGASAMLCLSCIPRNESSAV
jgi:MFS family permease